MNNVSIIGIYISKGSFQLYDEFFEQVLPGSPHPCEDVSLRGRRGMAMVVCGIGSTGACADGLVGRRQ